MLAASATLLFGTSAPALAMLLLGTVIMSIRFRGALGGGSDNMAVQVLTALLIARIVDHPVADDAAVFFIAVQSVLSYVRAAARYRQTIAFVSVAVAPRMSRAVTLMV